MNFHDLSKLQKINKILDSFNIELKKMSEFVYTYEKGCNTELYFERTIRKRINKNCTITEYSNDSKEYISNKTGCHYQPIKINGYNDGIIVKYKKIDKNNGITYNIYADTHLKTISDTISPCVPLKLECTDYNNSSNYTLEMGINDGFNEIYFEEELANGKKNIFGACYGCSKYDNEERAWLYKGWNNVNFTYVLERDNVIKKILKKTTPDIISYLGDERIKKIEMLKEYRCLLLEKERIETKLKEIENNVKTKEFANIPHCSNEDCELIDNIIKTK